MAPEFDVWYNEEVVFDQEKIVRSLLAGNYLSERDLQRAKESRTADQISLLDYLTGAGIVSRDIVGQAIAESLGVSYADLNSNQPEPGQLSKIDEETARKFRLVLFREEAAELIIATDDPAQENLKIELEKIFPGRAVKVAFSLPEDIDAALSYYQKSLELKLGKIIAGKKQIAPEILAAIFEDATVLHSSDIHFEPGPEQVLIRYRVDGVLRDAGRIPRESYENVINRIKVESGLRLDEHVAAQDGAMQFKRGGLTADLRASVIPTVEGEKVVLRVLGAYVQGFALNGLGLSEANRTIIKEASSRPFGMIVVTGPTGSGKTTTLYALLKLLNRSDVNITTIEDPVEYRMARVNQIQVNPLTNLTFAKGLRSIVRQDPDIILVGEIRDEETAEIAVNAALTGHLLLSTFHANDAATAIPRLLDMGVEPFLLASTLNLIVAQRLVRRVCESCKQSLTLEAPELIKLHPAFRDYFGEGQHTLYEGKGCGVCGGSGYRGRTAVFEIIKVTPELQELVLGNPARQAIWDLARAQGARAMFEDGVEKVRSGATTLAELLRVAEPPTAR